MYLSDIIKPLITEKLKEMCIGKKVLFYDEYTSDEIVIECKDVCFESDDGNCWVSFIDRDSEEYIPSGQGIDIYFEIKDE